MESIKLFYVCVTDTDGMKECQKRIDKWVEKNPAMEIKELITQLDDEEYVLTVHYDDNKEKEMLP